MSGISSGLNRVTKQEPGTDVAIVRTLLWEFRLVLNLEFDKAWQCV